MSQIPYPEIHRSRGRWRKGASAILHSVRRSSCEHARPFVGPRQSDPTENAQFAAELEAASDSQLPGGIMASRTSGGSACRLAHIGTGQDPRSLPGRSFDWRSDHSLAVFNSGTTEDTSKEEKIGESATYFHSPCITNAAQK